MNRRVRAWLHRLTRSPHDFDFWMRLKDGPETLIVQRCVHEPWCRAVQSFPYRPIVPESFVETVLDLASRSNPYRALSAAPPPGAPRPPATAPAGSRRPSSQPSSPSATATPAIGSASSGSAER